MVTPAEPVDMAAALDLFRKRQALWSRAEVDGWLQRNALDAAGLERLLRREAALDAAAQRGGPELCASVLEHLRLTGQFSKLLERARAKAALAGRDAAPPAGPTAAAVLDWYFTRRLGEPLPSSIAAWAHEQGWAGEKVFTQAVWRDYLFAEATR